MRDRSELGRVASSLEIGFSVDGALLAVAVRESTGKLPRDAEASLLDAAEELENLFLAEGDKRASYQYLSYLEASQGNWVHAVAEKAKESSEDGKGARSDQALVKNLVKDVTATMRYLAANPNRTLGAEAARQAKFLLTTVSELTLGMVDDIQQSPPIGGTQWEPLAAQQ